MASSQGLYPFELFKFHAFFHALFKFSKTLGSAVSFKILKTFLVLGYFLTLNNSTDTNSGANQNVCSLRCLITPLYHCPCLVIYSNKFIKQNSHFP